ncbi:helix-turn-helix domain-containing protein [Kitasatospora kifunensis]|nr:helix-turn-helix domain-containing protein [Kitasatospora kifunensis]
MIKTPTVQQEGAIQFEYLPDGRGLLRPHVLIVCEGCSKEALVRADGSRRFCSKSCSTLIQHAEGRSRQLSGIEHYAWKGANAQYQALHMRVARARGRADHCEWRATAGCKSRKLEWSHVHETDPSVPQNYRSLCKTCHQRYDSQTGADHANAKLTALQVELIRQRYKAGGTSQQALADEYGVSQSAISRITRRRHYR